MLFYTLYRIQLTLQLNEILPTLQLYVEDQSSLFMAAPTSLHPLCPHSLNLQRVVLEVLAAGGLDLVVDVS